MVNRYKTFKESSVLKYLLHLVPSNAELHRRLISDILQDTFLANSDLSYLKKIFKILSIDEKETFLMTLNRLSKTVLYNSFHYNLLNFIKKNTEELEKLSLLAVE